MPKRLAKLIKNTETGRPTEYPFVDHIEIGRARPNATQTPNKITFVDPRISSRHCMLTQTSDGRFLIRDMSRNGTRVDGKRLVPNIEFEIQPDQVISLGDHSLVLWAESTSQHTMPSKEDSTILAPGLTFVTIVVGDIRGYTTLSQTRDSSQVSRSVGAVFSELEDLVESHGGALKEHQGDAIFAFWEENPISPTAHTRQACSTALAMDECVQTTARDASKWLFADFPLRMDFAIATGGVVISSFGRDRPTGMSMVGDIVNLAFRIEKLATDDTGAILACHNTRKLVQDWFVFEDLGEVTVKGREGTEQLFALQSQKPA